MLTPLSPRATAASALQRTQLLTYTGGSHYFFASLLVASLYSLMWGGAFWLPKQLEVINYASSWYLPAGLRITALVLMPMRLWPAVVIGEMAAMRWVGHPVISAAGSEVLGVLAACLPMLCYGLPVYILRRSGVRPALDKVRSTFWLILTVAVGAVLWGLMMAAVLVFGSIMDESQFVPTWGGVAVGDGVAMTLVLPLALSILRQDQLERKTLLATIEQSVLLVHVVFITLLAVATYLPVLVNLTKFVALMPLMFLPYRFGWGGGVSAVVALNIVVLIIYLTGVSIGPLIDNQMYLAFGGLSALLLGAAISEQRSLFNALAVSNRELELTVRRLQQQRAQSEALAHRVVSVQEEERQALSRELHDGIGQYASALRVNLSVLRKRINDPSLEGVLSAMESITHSVYSVARELVHRLRPRVLDDLGLRRALEAPDIVSQLLAMDIAYHVVFDVDETQIDDELSIAIYRIVQECVNNAAKYSGARNFWVELTQSDEGVRLWVRDDGVGIDPNTRRSGLGLTTIRDRAAALKAVYRLDTDHRGTQHLVIFRDTVKEPARVMSG
jgi:two-component system sensor histidine kinase UhpB